MGKKLIIFKDKKLFNILDEIKENFEFELVLCEKEIELEKLENDNLIDYLVLTKKNYQILKNRY